MRKLTRVALSILPIKVNMIITGYPCPIGDGAQNKTPKNDQTIQTHQEKKHCQTVAIHLAVCKTKPERHCDELYRFYLSLGCKDLGK